MIQKSASGEFIEIQENLLKANSIKMKCKIVAEGIFPTDLEGEIFLKKGNKVQIKVSGTFVKSGVELFLDSDGKIMKGGNQDKQFEMKTPEFLLNGILVGAMGMGFLHNFAMLSTSSPPDRTDGTAKDWVQTKNHKFGEKKEINGTLAKPISFEIFVAGQPSGEATLWINEETNLPIQRNQEVQFPTGEMKVVESYEVVEIR
ncbi:MAG: hypothetical protein DWQ06_02490 [Calditrichaeota bacterium]|nr:MAG: hypothetical protein DWQ06_02490 [Calditrichota bacterium]